MLHAFAYAVVFIIICLIMSKTALLTAVKNHTAGLGCGGDEPPAKMISPSKAVSAGAGKAKRARKAAAKQRLAQQDSETQNGGVPSADASANVLKTKKQPQGENTLHMKC